jgi:hypothetical protein
VLVFLLAVGAGRRAVLHLVSETPVIPTGGCSSAVPVGQSVVRAAVPGTVVTVSGAGGTVPGSGAVPFSAESLHPAGQFFNVLNELGVVGWFANARERRPGDGLGYTVRAAARSVELNVSLGGKDGLYFPR